MGPLEIAFLLIALAIGYAVSRWARAWGRDPWIYGAGAFFLWPVAIIALLIAGRRRA